MKKHSLFLSIILVLFWNLTAYALDVTDFHESYTRDKGKPVTVTDFFTSNYQSEGKITFTNGDPNDPKVKLITSDRAWFNGKLISVGVSLILAQRGTSSDYVYFTILE